jgi:hypothetical protein
MFYKPVAVIIILAPQSKPPIYNESDDDDGTLQYIHTQE